MAGIARGQPRHRDFCTSSSTASTASVFRRSFKAGAIRLVLDEGKTVVQVASGLDLTESVLRPYPERAKADRRSARLWFRFCR